MGTTQDGSMTMKNVRKDVGILNIHGTVAILAGLLTIVVIPTLPVAAANTWSAGGGGDTNWSTTANWDTGVPASGADVTFGTAGTLANLDSNQTVGLMTFSRNFTLTNTPGALLTINTGLKASSDYMTVTLAGPIGGSGSITVNMPKVGNALKLNGNNAGFSGGFVFNGAAAPTGQGGGAGYEEPQVWANAANSLGTGQSYVGKYASLYYTSGALAAGAPALAVKNGGMVSFTYPGYSFSSTPNGANDKFNIQAGGIISGNATQLGALTRGVNVSLVSGAIVGHTALNQATINSLPTDASLLFGVFNKLNSAVSVNVGAGTPWGGLSGGDSQAYANGNNLLQQGTVAIDTTGLSAFMLQGLQEQNGAFNVFYTGVNPLYLGSGASAPAFTLRNGSSAIPARIQGYVIVDSTPNFAAFNKFVVANNGILTTTRSGGLASLPIDLQGGALYLQAAAAGSPNTAGAITVAGDSIIEVARKTAGTPDTLTLASITRTGRGVLRLWDVNSALGGDERMVVTDTTGLTRGNIVDPWIFRQKQDYNSSICDFLTYGATGFTNATALYTTTFGNGAIMSGVTSSSGSVNADSMRLTASITGSGTINLGVLPDGSRAARAGLLNNAGTYTVAPAIDMGGAELIVGVTGSGGQITLSSHLAATNGLTLVSAPFGSGQYFELRGTANDVRGPINILNGMMRINGGNGFSDNAAVYVDGDGSLYFVTLTGNIETIADLSGAGKVDIASGKTLVVTNQLTAGDATSSLTVTNTGTFYLTNNATASFDLDYVNTPTTTPRLQASGAALTIGAGAKVKLNSLANIPAGDYDVTYALVAYGSKTGTFSTKVQVPDGVDARLVYDDANKLIKLEVRKLKSVGFLLIAR